MGTKKRKKVQGMVEKFQLGGPTEEPERRHVLEKKVLLSRRSKVKTLGGLKV